MDLMHNLFPGMDRRPVVLLLLFSSRFKISYCGAKIPNPACIGESRLDLEFYPSSHESAIYNSTCSRVYSRRLVPSYYIDQLIMYLNISRLIYCYSASEYFILMK